MRRLGILFHDTSLVVLSGSRGSHGAGRIGKNGRHLTTYNLPIFGRVLHDAQGIDPDVFEAYCGGEDKCILGRPR